MNDFLSQEATNFRLAVAELIKCRAALAEKEAELAQEKALRAADIKIAVDHELSELREKVINWDAARIAYLVNTKPANLDGLIKAELALSTAVGKDK